MTVSTVVIVGSGPAGIGIASLLNQTDIDYIVLEKKEIGYSFLEWPEKMEMITPSFPSNAFGQLDLNSICESTSPGFAFNKEHLTGKDYSKYLTSVADHFALSIQTHTEVQSVYRHRNGWMLETNQGPFYSRYVIWAAGEFQNPQIKNISGKEHCLHSSLIKYPGQLEGDDFVIIGGYESGVQMAFDLIQNNKKVSIINPSKIDHMRTSDPSKVLSPYTYTKYRTLKKSPLYNEVLGEVDRITKEEKVYRLQLKDQTFIETEQPPICATGFSLVKKPIEELILYREDGSPKLYPESDEFFGQENIYLSGPSVRHDEHIFCFIYKFRQRFGVIAEDILRKEECDEEDIALLVNRWKVSGMYLSDLSCCANECVC